MTLLKVIDWYETCSRKEAIFMN